MTMKHPWLGVRSFQRHSLVLLVAGFVYGLIGFSYLLSDPTPQRLDALHYAIRGPMTLDSWGCVFIFVGLLAMISSRWPPISETWGYQALTALSTGWALFYLSGVVFHGSSTSNFSAFLLWGIMGFLWWAVSGLVNPQKLYALLHERDALYAENLSLHSEILRCKDKEE